ncbi:MAG: ABC transporter permease [Deltaproteobacteria bacterium]|nr:ABC transporter permease [Deltaproteobacteria bacterium]
MKRYILKRLFQAIICLFGVSIIVFSLSHLTGDPAAIMASPDSTKEDIEQLRITLGLDRPLFTQYYSFISGVVKGDLGRSLRWNVPCLDLFLERFPNTLRLAIAAMAFSILIGLPIGVLSAVRVGRWFDTFGKVFALMGQALPSFWLGIMLILIFSVKLRLLPSSGMGGLKHMLMPTLTLGWYFMASVVRMTRSSMLDVLDSGYIKMAKIVGKPEYKVIGLDALKNAIPPILTMSALNFVILLNGTVVIEKVFNWPGVGRLLMDAVMSRDFPVVQACVLIASFLFIFVNLLVDIAYSYIDPRIRYQ